MAALDKKKKRIILCIILCILLAAFFFWFYGTGKPYLDASRIESLTISVNDTRNGQGMVQKTTTDPAEINRFATQWNALDYSPVLFVLPEIGGGFATIDITGELYTHGIGIKQDGKLASSINSLIFSRTFYSGNAQAFIAEFYVSLNEPESPSIHNQELIR